MDKFKTISSIGLIGLVGLIAYLFWQVGQLKDKRADQVQEINRLEWLLSAKEAETDSIKNIGQYAETDTVWQTRIVLRIDTVTGKVDTVYEDIVGDIAKIKGVILVDTTKEFGPDNRLSVHVSGRLHYPEEYSYQNWMLIVPEFRKPPIPTKQQKTKSYAVGLGIALKTSQGAYIGLQGRLNRTSLGLTYDPWHRTALMTVGFDIWGF